MINELDALEGKITQVVALCQALRSENAVLRQRLAAAESERSRIVERMESARERLGKLAKQLPDADETV